MPTENKVRAVEQIQRLIDSSSITISTDYTGMGVNAMAALRRSLRQRGVVFRVVKNTLTCLAADAAGQPALKEIVQGPTGLAFGFDDPVEPARGLTEFIRTTRTPLKIRGGVLGDRTLTTEEIEELAALPSREALIARLLGQLQAPITSLAYVLNAPVSGLVRLVQRRIEAEGQGGTDTTDPA